MILRDRVDPREACYEQPEEEVTENNTMQLARCRHDNNMSSCLHKSLEVSCVAEISIWLSQLAAG